MPRPPLRYGRLLAGTALAAALLAVPVAAQQPDVRPETGLSPLADALGAVVLTLLIGGGFLLLAPEYTERTTNRILDEPGETFLYGFGLSIVGIVLVIVLAITVVGIVLVIPLVILAAVIAELGYLAVGRAVSDEWPVVLLVAVAVAAVASGVPYLGGLVGFVLGSMGIGAWYLEYRDDGTSGSGTDPGSDSGSDSGFEASRGTGPVFDHDASSGRSDHTGWDRPERDDGEETDDDGNGDGDEWSVEFDYGDDGDDGADEREDRSR